MILKKHSCLVSLIVLLYFTANNQAISKSLPGNEDLKKVVRSCKVLKEGKNFSTSIRGNAVLISLYRKMQVDKRSYKVDALLLTKSIMHLYQGVQSVNTYFYNSDSPKVYYLVSINKQLIQLFEAGSITDEELMARTSVIYGDLTVDSRKKANQSKSKLKENFPKGLDSHRTPKGYKYKDRVLILRRMQWLKSQGKDAPSVRDYFRRLKRIEDSIQKRDFKEADRLITLTRSQLDGKLNRILIVSEPKRGLRIGKIDRTNLEEYRIVSGARYAERHTILYRLKYLKSHGEPAKVIDYYFRQLKNADNLLTKGKEKEAEKVVEYLHDQIDARLDRILY